MNITYTQEPASESRAESRRRRVLRYRIPAWSERATSDPVSNHPFTGMLIAATAKAQLPALRRTIRSKYAPHVGAKQMAKLSQKPTP